MKSKLIFWFIMLSLIYLFAAFINLAFNPVDWGGFTRVVVSVLFLLSLKVLIIDIN